MSLLSRLNPANIIPRFPPYPGPYAVGSFEVEIPVTSLSPQGSSVSGVAETVQFRLFYPTEKPAAEQAAGNGWWSRGESKQGGEAAPETSNSKPVRWLPEPHQREYLSAYARFLGASSGFAEIVSHISRLLHYISLPAIADAPLLSKPQEHRFPTMIFSHGLGGTRLAYSHICGSIASYGVVVVAPEHRDGSSPVSFVKASSFTFETQLSGSKPSSGEPGIDESSATGRSQVDYTAYPHHVSDETANGRNRQLEIRLREISLIYTALCKLDLGIIPENTASSTNGDNGKALLSTFQNRLDVRTPGRVIWAGHSFGAATMFQLTKTVYHIPPPEFSSSEFAPLFTADSTPDSSILSLKQQITPDSPLLLLDLWCLPLLGKRTSHLFKQPLPQIAESKPTNILVIMSEEFWKWKENLNGVRRVLSPDPGRKRGGKAHAWFEQWDDEHERVMASVESPLLEVGGQIVAPDGVTPVSTRPGSKAGRAEPRFYYAGKSAHLSQSDFGILFPRAIRKAENPERILELNVRAAVQWLREAGFGERLGGGGEVDEMIFDGEVEGWARIGMEEAEEAGEKL